MADTHLLVVFLKKGILFRKRQRLACGFIITVSLFPCNLSWRLHQLSCPCKGYRLCFPTPYGANRPHPSLIQLQMRTARAISMQTETSSDIRCIRVVYAVKFLFPRSIGKDRRGESSVSGDIYVRKRGTCCRTFRDRVSFA